MRGEGLCETVTHLFVTSVHTGLLGAVLAVSARLWYAPEPGTAILWELTPLEDQQLAGLVARLEHDGQGFAGCRSTALAMARCSQHRRDAAKRPFRQRDPSSIGLCAITAGESMDRVYGVACLRAGRSGGGVETSLT